MTLKTPIRRVDDKSTVFTTNTVVLDVPIIKEKGHDYDE